MNLQPVVAQRVERLCSLLGSALWQVQGVEEILAKYYAIVFKLSDSPSLEEIESEFERNFAHTAGRLAGLIRKQRGEQDPLAARLSTFVDERAWLVHKLRRKDYLSLREEIGFDSVLARIQRVEVEAEQLIELFHNLLIDHFVSIGVPLEHIEEEHEKALREIFRK
ncbi:hypothetical protein GM160_09980 [Guyparkeria halophila]|uniref:Uncharacterized protein n=1 Tax=Guyparkeria halophila TaxID=47960 RepID=A0A6I6CYA2_9GAMM|nr:hypothetical protein [Guyparkeria halophila]QGT79189.1 hypothetical protein GM160_09980 [Guyparkeria halophila]